MLLSSKDREEGAILKYSTSVGTMQTRGVRAGAKVRAVSCGGVSDNTVE